MPFDCLVHPEQVCQMNRLFPGIGNWGRIGGIGGGIGGIGA